MSERSLLKQKWFSRSCWSSGMACQGRGKMEESRGVWEGELDSAEKDSWVLLLRSRTGSRQRLGTVPSGCALGSRGIRLWKVRCELSWSRLVWYRPHCIPNFFHLSSGNYLHTRVKLGPRGLTDNCTRAGCVEILLDGDRSCPCFLNHAVWACVYVTLLTK